MHILFITGAALVGIPILLHLIMRQEPKKLPFPAFRFLKLRRKTNQRKMRLRHFLLLFMRMLLIALVAWALFQPKFLSNRFNIKGEQAIACVIVIDTSPRMGYVLADRTGLTDARKRGLKLLEETEQGPWTALDDARFRALELIEDLPPSSTVAVIDTADREANWALSLPDARKKIRNLKKTKASSRPVTQTLDLAYKLFSRVDQEVNLGLESMPRLLCVLSDRTSPSWLDEQLPNLQEARERVPPPAINSIYIDVGIERPLNLALTGIEMKPQVVAANKPVKFSVFLKATGAIQENTVQVRFNDETDFLKKAVRIVPDEHGEVTFIREGLKPGLHQAEITLQIPDALPTDNIRYLTFRVREPRRVLLVANAPFGMGAATGGLGFVRQLDQTTRLWRIALDSVGWYHYDVVTASDLLALKSAQMGQYEAVVLAGLVSPSAELWEHLTAYVEGAGGQLIVVPGGADLLTNGPDKPPPGYENRLLPGPLKKWIEVDRNSIGITWTWDALKAHPFLNEFSDWLKDPKIDFVANRPQAWGYWEVEAKEKPMVIVSYADDSDADKRRPALLEKTIGARGKVMLFTTPLDGRYNPSKGAFERGFSNDYASSSFYMILTNFAVRYLTGDSKDANFNYNSG
ncbi:MAG: BatA domain-containing protein [Planctomycetes bacterium]|nr:BatA domain-containing protein [Planctomycetota bacterium]